MAAKLIDVDEDGHAWNVADGILRLRYRLGLVDPALLDGNNTYRVEVNLNTVAWYFKPGHRIRLYVTSSNFPMYDRNLNTGGDNVTETQWLTAHNVVHTAPDMQSALVLPVVATSGQ
jgi:putative CocE/NonD family hydrolase